MSFVAHEEKAQRTPHRGVVVGGAADVRFLDPVYHRYYAESVELPGPLPPDPWLPAGAAPAGPELWKLCNGHDAHS